jgi:site-specific recombinase XerD
MTTTLRLVEQAPAAAADPDLTAYIEWGRSYRGFSENTLRVRGPVLSRLRAVAGVPLREATEQHLRAWERMDVAGKSPQTRRAYISHVSSFYKWLLKTKIITEDPSAVLTRPQLPKPLPRPVTEQELRLALSEASPKLAAMIVLAAYAGLRCMEIAQLQWQDISQRGEQTIINVRHGKGDKDRAVPVGQVVVEALRAHGVNKRGPVFYGRDARQLQAHSVTQMIGQHFRRLDIDATAHKLRHRYATVSAPLLDNDLALLAQLCGWNSLETAKHYVLPDRGRVDRLTGALDELAAAAGGAI